MPIKILYVIDKMVRAGAQRHLAQLLSCLDRKRFQPMVCCLLYRGPLAAELEKEKIRVESLRLKNIIGHRFGSAVLGLGRIIRRHDIQIIHSYLFAANIVSPWAGLVCGVPVITSRRDAGFWKKSKHIRAHRISNLTTSRITANSQAVVDYLLRKEKVGPNRIVLIHNGLKLPSESSETPAPLSTGEKVIIGCLGNIRPVKGYEYLLSALKRLEIRSDSFELHIGGRILDQLYFRRLEGLVETYHLRNKVFFRGEISDVDVFLKQLHVFVLPSLSEGFPNALLEAMAAGRAVVATDVGGSRELIQEGRCGFLVPPADEIALSARLDELLDKSSLIVTFGKRARQRVENNFTSDEMCRRMQELYNQLVE